MNKISAEQAKQIVIEKIAEEKLNKIYEEIKLQANDKQTYATITSVEKGNLARELIINTLSADGYVIREYEANYYITVHW